MVINHLNIPSSSKSCMSCHKRIVSSTTYCKWRSDRLDILDKKNSECGSRATKLWRFEYNCSTTSSKRNKWYLNSCKRHSDFKFNCHLSYLWGKNHISSRSKQLSYLFYFFLFFNYFNMFIRLYLLIHTHIITTYCILTMQVSFSSKQ